MAKITCVSGPNPGTEFVLGYHNSIGSSLDNTVCLKEPSVSAQHAVIEYKSERFMIHRVNGRAKVLVNGAPIDGDVHLTHGDVVQLGNIMIIFSEEPPAPPSDVFKQLAHAPSRPESTTLQARIKYFEDSKEVINTFRKNEQLQARLEILYHVSSIISSTLDVANLHNRLFNLLFEVFDPDRVFVLLYDDVGKLKVAGQRLSEKCQVRGFVQVSRSILKEVIEKKDAILIRSALADERFSLKQSIIEQNIQSAMCAPLVKNDKILGVLYVDRLTRQKSYHEEDLNLLNAIASQVALAEDNARMYDKNREFARKLTKLSEASRVISTRLDRESVIQLAVESAVNVFECNKCSVMLYDEREGVLEMAHSNSIDRALWSTIKVKPGEGFCGRVFSSNTPMLVRDSEVMNGLGKHDYQSTSFLIVPIVSREEGIKIESKPIGVMAIADKVNGQTFDMNDQELLIIFSSQIGATINNAILFEKATIDQLTRVHTRQFFFVKLDDELRKQSRPLAVAMLDLDHFKECNDTYGQHQVGDRVLQDFGRMLWETVRAHGFVGRYGGDEFVVCFPCKNADQAFEVVDAFRKRMEQYQLQTPQGMVRVTVSAGVADFQDSETVQDVVRKADSALYSAKNGGRNRAEAYTPSMQTPPPGAHRAGAR